jgi:endoglucanase
MLRREFLCAFGGGCGLAVAGQRPAAALQSADHANNPSPAWTRLPSLDRGFNIPGWIGLGDDRAPAPDVLKRLRDVGFSAARLPVDPFVLVAPTRDRIVGQVMAAAHVLQQQGYSVTLDMHCGAEMLSLFETDPALARIYVEHAWELLLEEAVSLPEATTFFELLNEPPMDAADWHDFGAALATQVRRRSAHHTLLWGPALYQALWQLEDALPPEDPNIIIAVHYYEPMSFTHQGADWAGASLGPLKNVPFPGQADDRSLTVLRSQLQRDGNAEAIDLLERDFQVPWTAARLQQSFIEASQWGRRHNRPIVLNEFGAYGSATQPDDRAGWIRAVREAAEGAGIAWTYWELDGGFGFLQDRSDPASLDPDVLSALCGR